MMNPVTRRINNGTRPRGYIDTRGLVHNALLAILRRASNCGRQELGELLFSR